MSAWRDVPWQLGATPYSYGVRVWLERINALRVHLGIICDSLPEEAEWLQGQVAAAKAEADEYLADYAPEPPKLLLHAFEPHPKYSWFCDQCGYPPHEPLKHFPTQAIEARRAETLGSVHESAVGSADAPDPNPTPSPEG